MVLNTMAAPIPCAIRIRISMIMDTEKTAPIQQAVNKAIPAASTVFRQVRSAILPAGTENAATASVYPVTSHPTIPALTSNC